MQVVDVAADERERHRREPRARIRADAAGDAEVHVADHVAGQDEQIRRVQVRVKEPVAERVGREVEDDLPAERAAVEPLLPQPVDERLVLRVVALGRPHVGRHRHAVEILGDQHAPRGQPHDHFGQPDAAAAGRLAPHERDVPRFAPEVELFVGPPREFPDGFVEPVERTHAEHPDQAQEEHHHPDVGPELLLDARPLDLDGDRASVQPRHVDLRDRRGGERLGIHRLQAARRRAELGHHGLHDDADRHWRDAIEQVEELRGVPGRQQVRLDGEDLAEFDEAASEIFEQHAESHRTGEARGSQT